MKSETSIKISNSIKCLENKAISCIIKIALLQANYARMSDQKWERRCFIVEKFVLIPRDHYRQKLLRLANNGNVTFVVGVRRVGKSCIAAQLEEDLREYGADGAAILRYNFETTDAVRLTADDLINYVRKRHVEGVRNYLILDEVTHVVEWERAIDSLCQYEDCKLFLFSSNRRILSDRLDAVAKNAFDVVDVLPLSLPEFMAFQQFQEITPPDTPLLEKKYVRFNEKDRTYTVEEIYGCYITYGGLPVMKPEYMDMERAWVITDGSYGAIVTRDILEIGSGNGISAVTDPVLLRSVISIMAKSIGQNVSATWIAHQTAEYLQRPSATKTIESYIRALLNAHLFYIAERCDIRKEKTLKTLAKFYIVDAAIHNYVLGGPAENEIHLLENKVFFELIRRGYRVCNGKLGQSEVQLVASDERGKIYIQVVDELMEDGMDRKLAPLRKIRDSHPKLVIVFHGSSGTTEDGIVILNAFEFLMGASWGR